MSGLACALRLTAKKYDVTLYEKTDRLGGQLWDLLPSDIFLEDIRRQFQFENYALHLSTEIKDIKEVVNQGFEALYIATGKGGLDLGTPDSGNGPLPSGRKYGRFRRRKSSRERPDSGFS